MNLNEFTKKKDFLICIDSDGCAMDTLKIKHMKYFGPCMIEEWSLEEWEIPILTRWNEINLYSMTRGINRFQGLLTALLEIDQQYVKIDGLNEFEYWVEISSDHSVNALKAEISRSNDEIFKKALQWSEEVDEKINALPTSEKKAFDGVKEALEYARQFADIAILSTDNQQTLIDEWKMNGLLECVDVTCSLNTSTKVSCIKELMKKGYSPSHILMVGDAAEDMKAAQKNGVFFYPILVKHEKECWNELMETAILRLRDNEFAGPYQKFKIDCFTRNLTK